MSRQLLFELPSVAVAIAKLVEVAPSHWTYLCGRLEAPPDLFDAGVVEMDTGFLLDNYETTVVGRLANEVPKLSAFLAYRKHPGFVEFREAGEHPQITLAMAKAVLVAYIQRGYRGNFAFYFRPDEDLRATLRVWPHESKPCVLQGRLESDDARDFSEVAEEIVVLDGQQYLTCLK